MNAPELPPKRVIAAVCAFHRLTARQITDQSRVYALVWPRHELVSMLREFTGLSMTQIGALIGGRDHSTIQSSLNRVSNRMIEDAEYAAHIERLRAFVQAYDPAARGAPAVARARRLMSAVSGTHSPDADELALALLTVASILGSPELSDAEARLAAISVIGKEAGHA